MSPVQATIDRLRATVTSGVTRDLDWRRHQLRALRALVTEHQDALREAVSTDVGKPPLEADLADLHPVVGEIDLMLRHLQEWTAPQPVRLPLTHRPATAHTQLQPKGVMLIIGPWNYPVQLLLSPLTGALAAGNTAVLKPSEQTPTVAALLAELVPQHFDPAALAVVTGGVEQTTALLERRFDHIMFTGSQRVASIVMRAAAEHLTPVTLELGGKCPVYVDDTVHLPTAARRLVWGKFHNAGQTCVAPDYLLVTPQVHAPLVAALDAAVTDAFGGDPSTSADYGRIANDDHFDRLHELLEPHADSAATGGQSRAADRYIAPTIVDDVDLQDPLMAGEIFGPILPVVEVADHQDALGVISERASPLVVYVFSDDEGVRSAIEQGSASGAVLYDLTLLHEATFELPFGGVGASGMGRYHGVHSLREFSHERTVMAKPLRPDTMRLMSAPHPPWKSRLLRRTLMRQMNSPGRTLD